MMPKSCQFFSSELQKLANESIDWKGFEKNLKSPAFRKHVLSTTQDPKLRKYVQNFGESLGSKDLKAYVQSSTDPNKEHTVKALSSNRFSCTCKDWQYKHSVKNGDCRHIMRYKQYLQGLVKASSTQGAMNLSTLRSFRNELEKISARRGLKEIVKHLRSGNIEKAHAIAKTPGVVKHSPAGSQIKDLGTGSEGTATLVAHPQHGLVARKLYDPKGLSSPEMIARKEQAGKAIGKNPSVAQFYGAAQTPKGGTMHLNEYVPGRTSSWWSEIRDTKAKAIKAIRGAGFHGAQDIRAGNMITTPTGQNKVIDYMPSKKKEFKSGPSRTGTVNSTDHILKPTVKGYPMLQEPEGPRMSPGQLKGSLFRGAAPKGPMMGQFKPLSHIAPDQATTKVQRRPVSPSLSPTKMPSTVLSPTKLSPTVKIR